MKKAHKKIEVVLISEVEKLGQKGEKILAAKGYVQNYLIPQQKAILSTDPRAVKLLEEAAKKQKLREAEIAKAREIVEKISNFRLKMMAKATKDSKKIFGSITADQILKEISKNVKIELKKAKLIGKLPIRNIGNFALTLQLTPDVETKVNISVEAEKAAKSAKTKTAGSLKKVKKATKKSKSKKK
ncbi:MAG TPA: 50S ribosomal protein L9 [Patescibacteria group bacterium]|nr:50S ribosomal protein L9 [Patescibacteria group bacterium]